jgi:hypothetical protein
MKGTRLENPSGCFRVQHIDFIGGERGTRTLDLGIMRENCHGFGYFLIINALRCNCTEIPIFTALTPLRASAREYAGVRLSFIALALISA